MRDNIKFKDYGDFKIITNVKERTSDVEVKIKYDFPVNLAKEFTGVPHFYEHVVFSDIIKDHNSTDIMSLAKNRGVTVNACTSINSIIFSAEFTSLRGYPNSNLTKRLERFDTSDEAYEFLLQYIAGIVKEHRFKKEDVENERGIVSSEIKSYESLNLDIQEKLQQSISGYSILGSVSDIKRVTKEDLEEFGKMLSKPTVLITIPKPIEDDYRFEADIKKILTNYSKDATKKFRLSRPSRLQTVDEDIYDGVTDIRDIRFDSKFCNAIGFSFTKDTCVSIRSAEKRLLRAIARYMILDISLEGSLGHFLREVRGDIYAFDTKEPLVENNELATEIVVSALNGDIDLSDDGQLRDYCNMLDRFILNMKCPIETDYVSELANRATYSTYKNDEGISDLAILKYAKRGATVEEMIKSFSMDFDLDYADFVEAYDEVRNSMTVVVL